MITLPDDDPTKDDKKRHRRSADEIKRHFECDYPNCKKSYGSESALKMHIRLKHNDEDKGAASASSASSTLTSTSTTSSSTSSNDSSNFASPSTQATILSRVPNSAAVQLPTLSSSASSVVALQRQLQSIQPLPQYNQPLSLQSLRQLSLPQNPVFSPDFNDALLQLKQIQQLQLQQMQSLIPSIVSLPTPPSIPSLPIGSQLPPQLIPGLIPALSSLTPAPTLNVSTPQMLSPISVPAETSGVASPNKRPRLSPTHVPFSTVNCFIDRISIGNWKKESEHFGDLIGRFSLVDRRFLWESITTDGIFRIATPFDSISSLQLNHKTMTIECTLANPSALSLGQFVRLEDAASLPEQQHSVQNLWIQGIDFGPEKLHHTVVFSHLPTTTQELYKILSHDQHLESVIKSIKEEGANSRHFSRVFPSDNNEVIASADANLLLSTIVVGSTQLQSFFTGDSIGVFSASQRALCCESITTDRIVRITIPFRDIASIAVDTNSSNIHIKLNQPPSLSIGVVPGTSALKEINLTKNTRIVKIGFISCSTDMIQYLSQDSELRKFIEE